MIAPDEFVINLPTKELLEQVWTVGTQSGRNVDKFQVTGLTPMPADVVKPPRIAEYPTHVECRIGDRVDTGTIPSLSAKSWQNQAILMR